MNRRSFVALAASAMMLSACGFQLRGQQDYPFKRLAVAGATPAFAARLTRLVQGGSDTVVVNSATNADAILTVSEGRSFGTLTLSTLGVVEEFQLNYTLNYTLRNAKGELLIQPSTIALNRAMTYSTQYSQAKAAESDVLFADMSNDAVDQLTRRLAAVKTVDPGPGQSLAPVAPGAPLPPPPL